MDYSDTSREAFDFIRRNGIDKRLEREIIRTLFTRGEATCEEVEHFLGAKHQSVSPAFTTLRSRGIIERTGRRRPTVSGVNAHILRIAEGK